MKYWINTLRWVIDKEERLKPFQETLFEVLKLSENIYKNIVLPLEIMQTNILTKYLPTNEQYYNFNDFYIPDTDSIEQTYDECNFKFMNNLRSQISTWNTKHENITYASRSYLLDILNKIDQSMLSPLIQTHDIETIVEINIQLINAMSTIRNRITDDTIQQQTEAKNRWINNKKKTSCY